MTHIPFNFFLPLREHEAVIPLARDWSDVDVGPDLVSEMRRCPGTPRDRMVLRSIQERATGERCAFSFFSTRRRETWETPELMVTEFDRWVGENNIPPHFEYGKGWWDYVELIRRFSSKFDIGEVRVVGHYIVRTPPPEEELPMPAVGLTCPAAMVALKYDFGSVRWPNEWTVSVRRRTPYQGPTFGLFDPTVDLRKIQVDGLGRDLVFAPYRENQAEFTCELRDKWDVATLLQLVLHEG